MVECQYLKTMRALTIPGIFLILISLASDLYNRFVYAPKTSALEKKFDSIGYIVHDEVQYAQTLISNIIVITAVAGVVLCIIPVFKMKKGLAAVGILCALGAMMLRLM